MSAKNVNGLPACRPVVATSVRPRDGEIDMSLTGMLVAAVVARYLIVDDSPTIRMTLAAAIKQASRGAVEVVEVADGATAMKEFKSRTPDAVFLDIMLEEKKDGLDLLKEMLKIDPKARVIFVTGLPASDPKVVKGIQQGAFGYLGKPARTDAVRKLLNDMEAEAGRFGRIR